MMNGDAILVAVLSLREATERGFNRLEREMARGFDAVDMRFDALEARFDAFESRLDRFIAVESR